MILGYCETKNGKVRYEVLYNYYMIKDIIHFTRYYTSITFTVLNMKLPVNVCMCARACVCDEGVFLHV